MSRFVVRQGELDDMDSQQVLPVADTGGGEEEWDGSNQPAMPGTAEEYLRMVRRQAHGIPDVVCRPLAPTQVRSQLDSSSHAFPGYRVCEPCPRVSLSTSPPPLAQLSPNERVRGGGSRWCP